MDLTLPEQIGLLSLDDEKGKFAMGAAWGIAGGVLAELMLRGKLAVVDKHVHVADATQTGDPLLDMAVAMIAESKKPRGLQHWVGVMAHSASRFRAPLVGSLIVKGIVRREEGKVLWIFDVERYPEADGLPEDEVIGAIRSVIVDGATPDERAVALISISEPCGLLSVALDKDQLKYGKDRIKQVAKSEPIGAAVADAIQACQAAAAAAATSVSTTVAIT